MNGRTHGSMPRPSLGRWTPALVAGGVLAAVVIGTVVSSRDGASGSDSTGSSSDGASGVVTTVSALPEVITTVPGFTTTTLAFTPIATTLEPNDSGPQVESLQQRLIDLKFDPGPVDGYYGDATRAAVWAYEKLILGVPREEATGKVTPDTWASMHQNIEVLPERPQGTFTHLEVYLVPQVAVLFKDNKPALITHVSTGSGEEWIEEIKIDPGTDENPGTEPVTRVLAGTSITPGGIYTFNRRYVEGDGWRTGSLGRMYKPVYFNYGVAVHGSGQVPNKPDSHGCVRIPMHIAEYFPDLVSKGDAVYVFDGVNTPEFYGRQPPPFDQDITPTTTTSSTTTTVAASTTVASTTTVAKTTTTAPSTTAAPTTTTTTTTTTTVPPTSSGLPVGVPEEG